MSTLTRESVEKALAEAFPDEDYDPGFRVDVGRSGAIYVTTEWDDSGTSWSADICMRATVKTEDDLTEFIRAVRSKLES